MKKRVRFFLWLCIAVISTIGYTSSYAIADEGNSDTRTIDATSTDDSKATIASSAGTGNGLSLPSTDQPIKFKDADASPSPSPLFVLVTTLLFCVLALMVILVLRKRLVMAGRLPPKPSKYIKVLDSQGLKAGDSAHLLEVNGHTVLVVLGSNHSSLITLPANKKEQQLTGSDDR